MPGLPGLPDPAEPPEPAEPPGPAEPSGPPEVLAFGDRGALAAAARVLDAGGVVALPTDTVYGLAARVDRPEGVAAIFAAKGRPPEVALPVLIGRWRQLHQVAADWPKQASVLASRFWPGALTVVVPARPEVGPVLGGDGATVGLRRPGHRGVRRLCRLAGPLAVTSANRHGELPCGTAAQVAEAFPDGGSVALVLDGGPCDGQPSTVVDCTVSPPTCLREGGIPWSWIEASLR
ncbi:MAG TPA: L-threonylcarbamoyladenylate synthase [Acidimicrobiales bacterium]|nr:L-threonylcarbamoyladenylate synthase [Acidimicrobiales bacterium]